MADDDKVVTLKVVPRPPPAPLPKPFGQQCGACLYYMPEAVGSNQGICRRFPPPVMLTLQKDGAPGDLRHVWHFPRMMEEGWCGEWKERPDPKATAAAPPSDA